MDWTCMVSNVHESVMIFHQGHIETLGITQTCIQYAAFRPVVDSLINAAHLPATTFMIQNQNSQETAVNLQPAAAAATVLCAWSFSFNSNI